MKKKFKDWILFLIIAICFAVSYITGTFIQEVRQYYIYIALVLSAVGIMIYNIILKTKESKEKNNKK